MRKRYLLLAQLCFCILFATDLRALESHVLPNGLEVFIEENHLVPLATIRITFRAGAIVETPGINGLCHLYEHMLFKGNSLHRTQEQFMAALKRMGVGSWNGGTSTEYVTYYITIPSDRVDEGLEFWAYAVKSPLLSRDELVRERQVVHNEIAGSQSEPEYALRQAVLHALYPDYWYRRDVGGDLEVIDTATTDQLLYIKNRFYVPNNAALFVSGDVDPAAVVSAAENHFGDWPAGSGFPDLAPHRPLSESRLIAVPTSPTQGILSVSFTFRGPDAGADSVSTYGADVWGQMVNDPQGRFKNSMYENVPELHGGTRYISAGYFTQRDAGTTTFSFKVQVPEKGSLWDIITRLRKSLVDQIALMTKPGYFTPASLASAKTELENHDILSRETSAGYMANLSFWWASTSTGYYRSYLDNIKSVTMDEVRSYLNRYLAGRHFLTALWIHPEDDGRHAVSSRIAGKTP